MGFGFPNPTLVGLECLCIPPGGPVPASTSCTLPFYIWFQSEAPCAMSLF